MTDDTLPPFKDPQERPRAQLLVIPEETVRPRGATLADIRAQIDALPDEQRAEFFRNLDRADTVPASMHEELRQVMLGERRRAEKAEAERDRANGKHNVHSVLRILEPWAEEARELLVLDMRERGWLRREQSRIDKVDEMERRARTLYEANGQLVEQRDEARRILNDVGAACVGVRGSQNTEYIPAPKSLADRVDALRIERNELRIYRDRLQATVERMRPVVEKAEKIVQHRRGGPGGHYMVAGIITQRDLLDLCSALDEYRKGGGE